MKFLLVVFLGLFCAELWAAKMVRYQNLMDGSRLSQLKDIPTQYKQSIQYMIRLTPEDARINVEELELVFSVNQKKYSYTPDAQGNLDISFEPDIYRLNPDISVFNGGKGSISIGLDVIVRPFNQEEAGGKVVNIDDIRKSMDEYDKGVASLGWLATVFAPELKGVKVITQSDVCKLMPGHTLLSKSEGGFDLSREQIFSAALNLTCDHQINKVRFFI